MDIQHLLERRDALRKENEHLKSILRQIKDEWLQVSHYITSGNVSEQITQDNDTSNATPVDASHSSLNAREHTSTTGTTADTDATIATSSTTSSITSSTTSRTGVTGDMDSNSNANTHDASPNSVELSASSTRNEECPAHMKGTDLSTLDENTQNIVNHASTQRMQLRSSYLEQLKEISNQVRSNCDEHRQKFSKLFRSASERCESISDN